MVKSDLQFNLKIILNIIILLYYIISIILWYSAAHMRPSTHNAFVLRNLREYRHNWRSANKKLISRWDSERQLFTTSYTYYEIQKKRKTNT